MLNKIIKKFSALFTKTREKIKIARLTRFGKNSLITSIKNDNWKKVQPLFITIQKLNPEQRLAVLNHTNRNGDTALIWAARHGRTATVQALSTALQEYTPEQRLAVLNYADRDVNTALIWAAYHGHITIVQALLTALQEYTPEQRLAVLNYADRGVNTALIWAAYHGHITIVQALLAALQECTPEQRLAVLNHAARDGRTAITIAFEYGHQDIVRALQAAGAVLPLHLQQERQNNLINNKQSTHEASVHESLARSAVALKNRYTKKNNLNNLVNTHAPAIEAWSKTLSNENPKQAAAKRALARINDAHQFQESRTELSLKQALVLVWTGLNDITTFEKTIPEDKQRQDRLEILIQHLFESQREYALDDKGNEINLHGEDRSACFNGTFHKIISTLAGGLHPDVNLIFLNTQTVNIKAKALVGQLFDITQYKPVEINELKTAFLDEAASYILPAATKAKLKPSIKTELEKEFGSFVQSSQLDLNKSTDEALNSPSTEATQLIIKKLELANAKK